MTEEELAKKLNVDIMIIRRAVAQFGKGVIELLDEHPDLLKDKA